MAIWVGLLTAGKFVKLQWQRKCWARQGKQTSACKPAGYYIWHIITSSYVHEFSKTTNETISKCALANWSYWWRHTLINCRVIWKLLLLYMLLWPKVCCFSWVLETMMLLWVSYKCWNSKIYWSLGAIQCSREYKKFHKSITIHFNCSFMQQKQQTSGHNNIPLLGVINSKYLHRLVLTSFWKPKNTYN